MNKVFLFALQLGVLAPFWRSMQALLWANSGRASEGALWNIVYCGGPLLIACALARWRILKGEETFFDFEDDTWELNFFDGKK